MAKPTLEQRLAFGVLVAWAKSDREGGLICRHCDEDPYQGRLEHHKPSCVVLEAVGILGLKSAFAFNKRTYKFKRTTPPVPRAKPARFPPLGKTQVSVLESLNRHGNHEWFHGCGWVWNTLGGTERLLNSLVKRGLVERIERKYTKSDATFTVWRLKK